MFEVVFFGQKWCDFGRENGVDLCCVLGLFLVNLALICAGCLRVLMEGLMADFWD